MTYSWVSYLIPFSPLALSDLWFSSVISDVVALIGEPQSILVVKLDGCFPFLPTQCLDLRYFFLQFMVSFVRFVNHHWISFLGDCLASIFSILTDPFCCLSPAILWSVWWIMNWFGIWIWVRLLLFHFCFHFDYARPALHYFCFVWYIGQYFATPCFHYARPNSSLMCLWTCSNCCHYFLGFDFKLFGKTISFRGHPLFELHHRAHLDLRDFKDMACRII